MSDFEKVCGTCGHLLPWHSYWWGMGTCKYKVYVSGNRYPCECQQYTEIQGKV